MSYKQEIFDVFENNASPEEIEWLQKQAEKNTTGIKMAFVGAPRFISKKGISPFTISVKESNFDVSAANWSLDQLARIYLLLHFDPTDKDSYFSTIESLFLSADINEAVALYSALPLLEYRKDWTFRATEAVRTNIGEVFDAIAFGNPFPAIHFNKQAWNQLILKCIFNEKSIHRIVGLDERRNEKLAISISDFAHERWAANRTVPPLIWKLTIPYVNDQIVKDLDYLMKTGDNDNILAAFLVLKASTNSNGKALLNKQKSKIETLGDTQLTWKYLEK
ncbi:EboA domain-containing protein [Membranihabitans maritimus]|uniref:EboA domain-containing protein n=1 Tax=Membranihabitans maritimus TaxID=2904244 RepID=UPI001F211EC7|nr:EboA domain-containing protein [Membranihabitans maritimus]